ncbi:MAG: TadE/TadG family type IV pilus assembly protein [Pseudomonadota bacterium]
MKRVLRQYLRDDVGAITATTVVFSILLIIVAGIGVDLARVELARSQLQNALDRGALAATSFSQTEDPKTIVEEYVNNSKIGDVLGNPVVNVTRTPNDNTWFDPDTVERTLTADAEVDVQTIFYKLLDRDEFTVATKTTAAQTQKKVEISLVLDVSASMHQTNVFDNKPKLDGLQAAAKEFIETIFAADFHDRTSMTIVPFSGSVNPGPYSNYIITESPTKLLDADGVGPGYAHNCPIYELDDLTQNSLFASPSGKARDGDIDDFDYTKVYRRHGTFVSWNNQPGEHGYIDYSWCPHTSTGAILPHTNDVEQINDYIDALRLADGTGTDIALKWGLHTLSANSQPITQQLVTEGVVDEQFKERPVEYDEEETEKVLILITDGLTTFQGTTREEFYDKYASDAYINSDEFKAIFHPGGNDRHYNRMKTVIEENNIQYMYELFTRKDLTLDGELVKNISYPDVNGNGSGAQVKFLNEADGAYPDLYPEGGPVFRRNGELIRDFTESFAAVQNICEFMKQKVTVGDDQRSRVKVFTIGFNIEGLDDIDATFPEDSADLDYTSENEKAVFTLRTCATEATDAYVAESQSDLTTALSEISSEIFNLRLTE